ncbi:MAG: MFS transporter [Thermoprotei archaeon]
MDTLKVYAAVQSLASSIVQPFVSFLAVIVGVSGLDLGIVTSANSFFSSLSQYGLSHFRIRAKPILLVADVLLGFGWLFMGLYAYGFPSTYLVTYVSIAVASGISSFGWLLVMERLSVNSRGKTLAQYSFYSTMGGLAATLATGFVVNVEYSQMRLFFYLAAALYLSCALMALRYRDTVGEPTTGKLSPYLNRFYLVTYLFGISWSFAWPLFPTAQVYLFHMSELQVATMSVIGGSSTLLLQRRIGALVDRNRKLTMYLGRLGLSVFPLSYLVSPSVYYLYAFNLMSGFTNSVGNTAYFSYLFDNAVNKKKAIGVYSAAGGLGALTGSLTSGALLQYLTGLANIVHAVRLLLSIAVIARIIAATMYLFLRDRQPASEKLIS